MNEITCLLLICAVVFLGGIVINILVDKLKASKTAETFKEQFDKTNLPILSLYQGDKKYNFIVDTGSTCNVINTGVLKKLKHTKQSSIASTVTASGDVQHNNSVVNISFTSSRNEMFVEDFISLDIKEAIKSTEEELGEKIAGILGNEFLNHYSKQISFKDFTIK